MERRDIQFTITNTLLAVVLLNSLGQAPTRWFETASFILAVSILIYVIYTLATPYLGKLSAQ